MSIKTTVLFGKTQCRIADLIADRLSKSVRTSIVTGFATPGGLNQIRSAIVANPQALDAMVIGAATFPGYQVLDEMHAAGVPLAQLFVHLGHTKPSGSRKHPTVRYHPMLHSKIYYAELPGDLACAFVGSHNLTAFALGGLNGEASVMLEGPAASPEFQAVRDHITEARGQSVSYNPGMKDALAWWTREFIDGLGSEVKLPVDAVAVRTILIFAESASSDRPQRRDRVYFEIPQGIEQIESMKTEVHLFLFDKLPATAWSALELAATAKAGYTCTTRGVENGQGNLEINADWEIQVAGITTLAPVQGGILRPQPNAGMQQVCAEVILSAVEPFEYLFENARKKWDPVYVSTECLASMGSPSNTVDRWRDTDDSYGAVGWQLVKGLVPRDMANREKDQEALNLAAPESGSFILVALGRRPAQKPPITEAVQPGLFDD